MTQDAKDLLAKFDAGTTAVGKRIDDLVAASKSMNAEDKAAFSAVADNLEAMGKNPDAPIPPLPPV